MFFFYHLSPSTAISYLHHSHSQPSIAAINKPSLSGFNQADLTTAIFQKGNLIYNKKTSTYTQSILLYYLT